MMTDAQIKELKALAKQGDVYYRDSNGTCHQVLGVNMDWVELPEEPELTEPAAILKDTVPAALYSSDASDFFIMRPAFEA